MKKEIAIIAGAVVLVVAVAAAGYAFLKDDRGTEKRGSAQQEFDTSEEPETPPRPKATIPWPTYAFDNQRTHLATGFKHRPPYRKVWRLDGKDTLEFPPSVGYGRVFLAQQKGLFFAIDGKTGKVRWKRNFKRCAASSPAIGRQTVYQAYMDFTDCPQGRSGASGFVIAMNYKTGKRRWIYRAGPVESSPLLHKRHAVLRLLGPQGPRGGRAHRAQAMGLHRRRGDQHLRRLLQGDDLHRLRRGHGVRARRANGAQEVVGQENSSEFFYATPTVAYGRVFIGNTDGTMYAYGARSGRLLWAKPLGSYIYSAAAVAKKRVFTGTYDGFVYSLNAATGDVGLAQVRAGRGARIADHHERAGLLLHLRDLRLRGLADGEEGGGQHRGLQHAHRPRALAAQPGEVREPGGGRLEAGVPDGPLVPVRADRAIKQATAAPVAGQTR